MAQVISERITVMSVSEEHCMRRIDNQGQLVEIRQFVETNSASKSVGQTCADLLAYTRERRLRGKTIFQVSKVQVSNWIRRVRDSRTGVFDCDDLVHVETPGFAEKVQWLRWNSLIHKVSIFILSENRQFLINQKI